MFIPFISHHQTIIYASSDSFYRFSPSAEWYLNIINQVFLLAGNIVPKEVANNLMRLIAEDTAAEEYDRELRINAVKSYYSLINRPILPDSLVQVICWVIGEFSHLDDSIQPSEVLIKMSELLQRSFDDTTTNSWILSAMIKVVAHSGVYNDTVTTVIKRFQHSGENMDIRQKACEFDQMCQDLTTMKTVLPSPTSQSLEIDATLSFLDEYVSEGLAQGAPVYKSRQQRQTQQLPMVLKSSLWAGLNFEPYKSPSTSVASTTSKSTPPQKSPMITIALDPSLSSGTSGNSSEPIGYEDIGSRGLNLTGVRKVWSKEGYKQTKATKHRPGDTISTIGRPIDSLDTIENRPTKSTPITQISSATATGVTSLPSEPAVQSEEEKIKHQLANALFSGIVGKQEQNTDVRQKQNNSSQKTVFTDSLVEGVGLLDIGDKDTETTTNVDLLSSLHLLDDVDVRVPELPATVQTGQLPVSRNTENTESNLTYGKPSESQNESGQQSISTVGTDFETLAVSSEHLVAMDTKSSSNNSQHLIAMDTSSSNNSQDLRNFSKIMEQTDLKKTSVDEEEISGGKHRNVNEIHTNSSGMLDEMGHFQGQVKEDAAKDLLLGNSETISSDVSLLDTDNEDTGMMLESSPVSTCLPDELTEYPYSKDHIELVSDVMLRISACKVWKPDVVAMVIFIVNQSKDTAKEVKVILDIPSNLKVNDFYLYRQKVQIW
ncbi:uncharacterized protein LOC144446205 [Glandiceps talaboti]